MGRGKRAITKTSKELNHGRSSAPLIELIETVSLPHLAELAYEKTFVGIQAKITSIVERDARTNISGQLVDISSSEKIGEFGRVLMRRGDKLLAIHSSLRLDEEYRGRGFTTQWFAACEKEYRLSGVSEIALSTNTDGSAYWPTQGFKAKDPEAALAAIWDRSRHVIDVLTGEFISGRGDLQLATLRRHKLIDEQTTDLCQQLVSVSTLDLSQIVAVGYDKAWITPYGKKMWAGRAIVTGADYEAVKNL
jgi:GNAT superfamily N-acetyltransferase